MLGLSILLFVLLTGDVHNRVALFSTPSLYSLLPWPLTTGKFVFYVKVYSSGVFKSCRTIQVMIEECPL